MENDIQALQKENERLQQQLHDQQKLSSLGLLSAGIAHEIQNPLNFVINFSKMSAKLIDDLNDIVEDVADKMEGDDAEDLRDIADDLKGNMDKIREHGERAISIIQGILLLSRGKDGEFLPTDVCNLVHEYVWLSYHAMRANDKSFNISIHENYQEGMPKLMVIPQDLSRAVLNVMNNACYTVKERAQLGADGYTPTVETNVKLEGDTLSISIHDNGMGMPQEVREKLFKTFFTTKPIGKGTGLGMSITHDLIANHLHGDIQVDSAEGEGTTFTFVIPVKIVK